MGMRDGDGERVGGVGRCRTGARQQAFTIALIWPLSP